MPSDLPIVPAAAVKQLAEFVEKTAMVPRLRRRPGVAMAAAAREAWDPAITIWRLHPVGVPRPPPAVPPVAQTLRHPSCQHVPCRRRKIPFKIAPDLWPLRPRRILDSFLLCTDTIGAAMERNCSRSIPTTWGTFPPLGRKKKRTMATTTLVLGPCRHHSSRSLNRKCNGIVLVEEENRVHCPGIQTATANRYQYHTITTHPQTVT